MRRGKARVNFHGSCYERYCFPMVALLKLDQAQKMRGFLMIWLLLQDFVIELLGVLYVSSLMKRKRLLKEVLDICNRIHIWHLI